MLADVLERFLHDSQYGCLLRWAQSLPRSRQIRLNSGTRSRAAMLSTASTIEPSRPSSSSKRRPQLADERSDLAQFAPQDLTQEVQLAGGHPNVLAQNSLDVLDLEDGVG
jgi:hypothetical protein